MTAQTHVEGSAHLPFNFRFAFAFGESLFKGVVVIRFIVLIPCLLATAPLQAVTTISNWNLTTTLVSFEIAGTLDYETYGASSPPFSGNTLFIGDGTQINSEWILTSGSTSRSIVNAGGPGQVGFSTNSGGAQQAGDGDALVLNKSIGNFALGDEVEATISFGGSFDPSKINFGDLILVWGDRGGVATQFPDNGVALVANFTAIPEPGTYAIIAGVLGLCAVFVRRFRS